MHLSEIWHSKKKRLSLIPNSGYLVYALICETSTFHRFAYYTDEGYEMFDLKLYPGIEAFNYIKEWFAFISIITAIPFIVLFIMRTWRYFCIKF